MNNIRCSEIAEVFVKERNDKIYYLGLTDLDILNKRTTQNEIRAGIGSHIVSKSNESIFDFEVTLISDLPDLYDDFLKEEKLIILEDGTKYKVRDVFSFKGKRNRLNVMIITKQILYYADNDKNEIVWDYYREFEGGILSKQDNCARIREVSNTKNYKWRKTNK